MSILCSCIYEDEPELLPPDESSSRNFGSSDRMITVSRADESDDSGLNFYLCDDNGQIVLHVTRTSATLRFECLPGDYRMRIAAKLGRDSGR